MKFYKSSNDYIGNIGYSISYDNYGDTFEEVESIKLTQFIKENILDNNNIIYILKLDVEGAEFDILEDIINENIYMNICHIFVETHERFFEDGKEKIERIKNLIKSKNIKNIYLDWI